jgi:hypothetical protein
VRHKHVMGRAKGSSEDEPGTAVIPIQSGSTKVCVHLPGSRTQSAIQPFGRLWSGASERHDLSSTTRTEYASAFGTGACLLTVSRLRRRRIG